jgi:hypothetical protein
VATGKRRPEIARSAVGVHVYESTFAVCGRETGKFTGRRSALAGKELVVALVTFDVVESVAELH